jgi:LysW-gamma-L-lysine carboxypeptidase
MIGGSEILTLEQRADVNHLYDERKKQARISLAEKILETYSPSGEEGKIAEILRIELENCGLSPRIDAAGNVICDIGFGSDSLLLCPHVDTIPGKLPFRQEGSVMYGRGASDAKGALLSMLFAFEDMAKELEGDPARKAQGRVTFAAVVEEERESTGLNQLIKDNVRANGAIFGEPGGLNRITIGYRGHLPVSFEVTTKEAHASAPWTTTNAAEVSFLLYDTLRKKLSARESQGNASVSVALTKIESGVSHNVIPGKAKMSVDVRIPIGLAAKDIAKIIVEVASKIEGPANCKVATSFGELTEPYKAKLNSKLVRAMTRSMARLNLKPSFISKSGTGDMNTYALAFGVDAVTYGPGDPRLSHTDLEYIDMEEVFSCATVLVYACKEFFELSG